MKKKQTPKNQNVKLLGESNFLNITQETNGQLFFEIGTEITQDIGEAVAIMMRKSFVEESVWEKQLPIDIDSIEPKKTLYWLSGGDNEWIPLHNYKTSWSDCELDFQEEFGIIVISVLKKSKTLGDIRNGFIKYLNLPTLFEFALSKDFVYMK